jgi:hypothetical protein
MKVRFARLSLKGTSASLALRSHPGQPGRLRNPELGRSGFLSRGSMEVIDPEYPDKNRLLSPSSFNYALYALVITTFLR